MRIEFLRAFLLGGIAPILLAPSRPQTATRIDYLLRYERDRQQWEVTIRVHGLAPAQRPVTLHLDDWGGWTAEPALYPRVLDADPPVTIDGPTQLTVTAPEPKLASLRVTYAIPVSERGGELHRRCGAMPWRTDRYACGHAVNTLMHVYANGKPLSARRTVTVTAPPGMTIVTGWAGASEGSQTVDLEGDVDNALVYFGSPSGTARDTSDGVSYEVFQFGPGRDITARVLALAQTLIPAYGASTGRKNGGPIRLFVADTGGGGVRTDHGIAVGWTPSEEKIEQSPYFALTVAHELFHEWLGGFLEPPGEATVWLHEGFTDYLALWHLARTGLVPRAWFAERLLEIERAARGSSAFGKVAFAGHTDWRDGDGPLETLAYKGGALLAFFLDVALREEGHRGLAQLIGDLIPARSYTLASVRSWLEAHGLADFYRRHVEQPVLPDLTESLAIVGFTRSEAPLPLTYVGIRSTGEPFGTIVELDPDGPAAAAGAKVGDVITGFSPTRGNRPEVSGEVSTAFRFGLAWFDPDARRIDLGIRRNGEDLKLAVEPRLIPGGRSMEWRMDAEAADDFFAR